MPQAQGTGSRNITTNYTNNRRSRSKYTHERNRWHLAHLISTMMWLAQNPKIYTRCSSRLDEFIGIHLAIALSHLSGTIQGSVQQKHYGSCSQIAVMNAGRGLKNSLIAHLRTLYKQVLLIGVVPRFNRQRPPSYTFLSIGRQILLVRLSIYMSTVILRITGWLYKNDIRLIGAHYAFIHADFQQVNGQLIFVSILQKYPYLILFQKKYGIDVQKSIRKQCFLQKSRRLVNTKAALTKLSLSHSCILSIRHIKNHIRGFGSFYLC